MRLMLVEDDKRLARGMAAAFHAAGFAVDIFPTGDSALAVVQQEPYGAIILDLGLPDIDGLDLLKSLRRRGVSTPIIILTARGCTEDRIIGLDNGADDYMVKPFDPRELESRVRALIRRSLGSPNPIIRIGSLTLDRSSRTAWLNGEMLALRRREMAVLEALMGRPGKILAKERLAAEIFDFDDEVAPNALEVHVGRLRRKLQPHGPAIRTVRGLGYIIETA
ncbi:response regulator [Sphingomonas sp. MMS24-J13]|uniref:response regulator n=1 Tax=Sphingomonas sp. MMS24-J13 TaxID=3238686 RepID=UPI00384E86EF